MKGLRRRWGRLKPGFFWSPDELVPAMKTSMSRYCMRMKSRTTDILSPYLATPTRSHTAVACHGYVATMPPDSQPKLFPNIGRLVPTSVVLCFPEVLIRRLKSVTQPKDDPERQTQSSSNGAQTRNYTLA